MVVNPPETQHPQFAVRGTEAVDVSRAPLSRQLAEVSYLFFIEVLIGLLFRGMKFEEAKKDF